MKTLTKTLTLEEELKEIFNYYNKRYKLKLKLYFDYHKSFFRPDEFINIDFDEVKQYSEFNKKRFNCNDFRELTLTTLLHELGHAIDHKINKKYFLKEFKREKKLIFSANFISENYYSLPLEKRADKFVIKEINKWKKRS